MYNSLILLKAAGKCVCSGAQVGDVEGRGDGIGLGRWRVSELTAQRGHSGRVLGLVSCGDRRREGGGKEKMLDGPAGGRGRRMWESVGGW